MVRGGKSQIQGRISRKRRRSYRNREGRVHLPESSENMENLAIAEEYIAHMENEIRNSNNLMDITGSMLIDTINQDLFCLKRFPK